MSESTTAPLPSNEGGNAATSGATANQSVAEVLNAALGKQFPNDEVALKSVKDTFSLASRAAHLLKQESSASQEGENAGRPRVADVAGEVNTLKQQLEEMQFFNEKPEMKPYAEVLREARGMSGRTLKDIAESQAFKSLIDKAKVADEAEKTRTVLPPNSRLGTATTKLQEAQQFAQRGDSVNAGNAATAAVIDAFLKQ